MCIWANNKTKATTELWLVITFFMCIFLSLIPISDVNFFATYGAIYIENVARIKLNIRKVQCFEKTKQTEAIWMIWFLDRLCWMLRIIFLASMFLYWCFLLMHLLVFSISWCLRTFTCAAMKQPLLGKVVVLLKN